MPDWKKHDFWGKVKLFAESRMTKAWMHGGNCDSCCPKCKQWESKGNSIATISREDGSDDRKCPACGYSWKTIFTPAGFVEVEGAQTRCKWEQTPAKRWQTECGIETPNDPEDPYTKFCCNCGCSVYV